MKQCGWPHDKYELSWQIVSQDFVQTISDPDAARVERVFEAMLRMKKIDIDGLQRALAGDNVIDG